MTVYVPYRLILPPPPLGKTLSWAGGHIRFLDRSAAPSSLHEIAYELTNARREMSPLVEAAVNKFEEDGTIEGVIQITVDSE